jgi:hypothetical protein
MRYAMFSASPIQKPIVVSEILAKPFKVSSRMNTIVEDSVAIDEGVIDVEGFDLPLASMIQKYPSLPVLKGIEGGESGAGVPFLKRARTKIARSKSMSFLQRL